MRTSLKTDEGQWVEFLEARTSLELGLPVTHVLAVLHSRSIVILCNGLDRQDSYQEGPESN